jgi:hypothetical protein
MREEIKDRILSEAVQEYQHTQDIYAFGRRLIDAGYDHAKSELRVDTGNLANRVSALKTALSDLDSKENL